MIKLKEITDILENWSPLESAEEFDNVGLLVGNAEAIINKAIITIDTTEEVIEEAIGNNCNLIITFHPIIFNGIKKFNNKSYVDRVVSKAIKHNINIYAIHTNLDNNPKGVNFKISQKLSLKNLEFLIPKEGKNLGMGMIGDLNEELSEIVFLDFLKSKLKTNFIKHSKFIKRKIKKVAVLGGSGSFAIEDAIYAKVDCFVTSDLKYHDYFKAENKLLLVDVGHYESEQYTKELILEFLNKKIPKFACIISKTNTNPVNYF